MGIYLQPTNTLANNVAILQASPESQVKDLAQTADAGQGGSQTTSSTTGSSSAGTSGGASVGSQSPYNVGNTGSLQERLLAPSESQLGASRENLAKTTSDFQTAAGPSRSWETSGGQQAINQAATPFVGAAGSSGDLQKQQDVANAKAYVQANYGGPGYLDPSNIASLNQNLFQVGTAAKAAQTGQGLSTMIGQAVGGLTTGEKRAQAQRMVGDTGFQTRAQGLGAGVQDVVTQGTTAWDDAVKYAQQRQAEEAAIAKQAREYAMGLRKTQVEDPLAAAIDKETAQRQAVQNQYDALLASNTAPTGVEGMDEILGSTGNVTRAEAKAAYDAIMNDPRYAAIKGQPLLTPQLSRKYELSMGQTAEAKTAGIDKDNKKAWEKNKKLLRQRQDELEKLFSPVKGEMRGMGANVQGPKMDKEGKPLKGKTAVEGKYSTVMPLYGASAPGEIATWAPSNLGDYVTLDQGTAPTRESVATPEQRAAYNQISDMLDEAVRISQTDPNRAASMVADAQRYLGDEAASLKTWDTEATKGIETYLKKVGAMRGRYHEQEHGGMVSGMAEMNPKKVEKNVFNLGGDLAQMNMALFGQSPSTGVDTTVVGAGTPMGSAGAIPYTWWTPKPMTARA